MSSTILRFRRRTAAMSTVEADGRPNSGPLPDRLATFALQMTSLLGKQAIFGQEPPISMKDRSRSVITGPGTTLLTCIHPLTNVARNRGSTHLAFRGVNRLAVRR